jgi:hypothetical protein
VSYDYKLILPNKQTKKHEMVTDETGAIYLGSLRDVKTLKATTKQLSTPIVNEIQITNT